MVVLMGCAGTSSDRSIDHGGDARARLQVDRYVWIDASCSDGAIDLAATGFERTVELQKRGKAMLLTFDTTLATEGCRTTSVWTAEPDDKLYLYQLRPEAWVSWPMRNADAQAKTAVCGAEERAAVPGEIHIAGDTLEIVAQRSPWCRGFDAHFIYRSAPSVSLPPEALVARYVAHFSRGDAAALAGLFEDHGALIESFSASADGQPTRHEGRAAIEAYFERAFAGATWHAARLLAFTQGDDENVIIADLEYIDSELQEPLRVRASFVLAGGEIYESDTQLVTDPKPAPAPVPASAPANVPAGVEPKS